ncbi:MAG TPA: hypothetical protein VJT81_20850 [Burkholderiales bacterium]|nr:hypothetical protein [Burkholderiales bacterium]
MLGLLAGVLAIGFAGDLLRQNQRQQRTTDALAQAREALIGYAAGDNNRPGSLPCPDTDNNGSSELFPGSNCEDYVTGSNVYIGRLPWRTLGLPDLRDGSGERLWYAVSRQFARNPTCMPNCPLTSDTLGQLTVTGIAPATNAVSIIFAPGATLGSQSRGSANENNPTNYLEGENADGNNPTFTTAADSSTFNDRLLAVTNGDLMPAVERRVAREMMRILQNYKTATGVYPWADRADGNSDGDVFVQAWNHSRFPCNDALPTNWGSGGTPSLPPWLTDSCFTNPVTGWTSVILYAVARNRLQNGCTNCTATTLTVSNPNNRIADLCLSGVCTAAVVSNGSADLVLITPGAATTTRAGGWPDFYFDPINGYFEDGENADNSNDNYVVPSSTNLDRDHIYIAR